MITLKDLDTSGRLRMTTYETNEDGTVTRRLFWKNPDETEELIKEEIIQNEEVYQSLQDTFNQ